jgi:3-hydroxybutyryl-CoA dehydrogenase
MQIKQAVVFGSGMMGPGIAGTLARAGVPTVIVARSQEKATLAVETSTAQLDLVAPGEQAAKLVSACVEGDAAYRDALEQADLVIESIPENMALKQDWMVAMEALVREDTILASNTSGLSITVMGERARRRDRIATTHFWNPPHLMPLVEIVRSPETSDAVVETLHGVLRKGGKVPVVVKKDRPGQLGNRLQMAMVREAVYVVQEGIADPEDVDTAAKLGFGLRLPVYGVLEHQDIVGRDAFTVCDYVSQDLYNQPGAPDLYQRMKAEGRLGALPGHGFGDWTRKNAGEVKQRRDEWLLEFMRSKWGKLS